MSIIQDKLETKVGVLIVLTFSVVIWGGLAQVLPLFFQYSTTTPVDGLKPYTALQLEGRDIYIREGCVGCHSQMIRPFRAETERYGHYSVAGEFIYDRPFLWGSKRTGPDLHRVGGRYSDDWHRVHLINPRDVVPESIMPSYPWLETNALDGSDIQTKMKTLVILGHPYSDAEIEAAPATLEGKMELDAVVAYLQSLGLHVKRNR
ncbi:MAG: cytochrome-c oxidase, cbb3-type subunit II [Gammaproteobacteria bacterium]|nr:MAG: cytochrome-c oxidase, cbb3-type subunit II [Gammaproteobacteria bacterium]